MLVHNYLERWAKLSPSNIAIISQGKDYSYHLLDRQSNQLATWLFNHDINPQDRVLVFLENSIEAVVSLFGISKVGAVFIIPNPAMKARKLKYILNNSDTKVLITHAKKMKIVEDAVKELPFLKHIILVDIDKIKSKVSILKNQLSPIKISGWIDIESYQVDRKENDLPRTIDVDLATIIYTSGSTGNPKGVMSAHVNMISAIRSITQYLNNTENDIILCSLPMSFDYGLYQILMGIKVGGKVILEANFVFPYKVLEQIPRYNVTGLPIVPSMLALIFELKQLDRLNFSSLRYISNTAAALPAKYIKRLKELWPHVDIYSMYGLTECKRVCFLPPDQVEGHPNSVGIPMPNVDVALVGNDGQRVPQGEIGELVVRGSNVMQGYWKLPKETKKTFRPGNYRGNVRLHSGDYFKQDKDGYLYFVGRKDDMIKTKGERVSPREIEDVLNEMKEISEVIVVGYPDEIAGQSIRAHIVTQNSSLTEKKILKHCKKNLEPFMIPKVIIFEKYLSKNNNGKIDKKKYIRNNLECRRLMKRRICPPDSSTFFHGKIIERRNLKGRRSLKDRRYV